MNDLLLFCFDLSIITFKFNSKLTVDVHFLGFFSTNFCIYAKFAIKKMIYDFLSIILYLLLMILMSYLKVTKTPMKFYLCFFTKLR